MAYIPKDDEQQQSGMNVLGQPQQNQQQQQNAQNQPQQTSGGQSASIASGQPQQAPQGGPKPPQAPKKQAKSGMFSNIRKYMERNKPGAQQMSGKLQQNISQQNQSIQQAIGKQKTDFMSRVNQNRQRMEQARGFGQDVVNRAQTQVDQNQLAAQQQGLQNRIGAFGPIDNQYVQGFAQQQQPQQSFEDYYKQQTNFAGAQTGLTDAQQAYQQAQQAQEAARATLAESLADNRIASQEAMFNPVNMMGGTWTPAEYYTQEQIQNQLADPSSQFLDQASRGIQGQIADIRKSAPVNLLGGRFLSPEQEQQIAALEGELQQIQSYRDSLGATTEAQTAKSEAQKRLESLQTGLAESKEAQRLFENKRALEGELAQLQEKIANAPEQLTDEEVERFNNLRTGVERFDDAILNLSQQQAQTQDLAAQAESLGTAQGRRDMLRKQFGAKGGYSAGQAALDNLILTGDKQGMRDLIQNTKEQAKQSEDMLKEAFQQGRITQDEMRRGSDNIRKELQASVDEAQTKLLEGSKEYRDMTKNLTDLESRLANDVLTPEERTELQTQADSLREQVSSFEGDIGLTGRARTGEGTMLKQIQDKLKSGQGLSAEEMNILGIDPNNPYAKISDDMLRNVQIDPETFSIQDVATSQDVARATALARLAGGKPEDYMQNKLGLEQDQLDRIKSRGLVGEGEEYGTTFEELSQADRDALSGAREKVLEQQDNVKSYSDQARKAKSAAKHAKAMRDIYGGGTKDWKYWNHYYVTNSQTASKFNNKIKNMMNEDNMLKSESTTKQQALANYLKKFRK